MELKYVLIIAFVAAIVIYGIYYAVYSHAVNAKLKKEQETDFEDVEDKLKLPSLGLFLKAIMVIVMIVYITKLNINIDELNSQVYDLQKNGEVLSNNLSHLNGAIDDLENLIRTTNSSIANLSAEIEDFDTTNNTVSIKFEVSFKTIAKDATVAMLFEGNRYEMKSNGQAGFTAIIDQNIFEKISNEKIQIEFTAEDGTVRAETVDLNDYYEVYNEITGLRDTFFTSVIYSGEIDHIWKESNDNKNIVKLIAKDGEFLVYEPAFDGDKVEAAKLVFKIDGKVIDTVDVISYINQAKEYNFDKEFEMTNDQILTINLELTHSLGYVSVEQIGEYVGDGSVNAYIGDIMRWYDLNGKELND